MRRRCRQRVQVGSFGMTECAGTVRPGARRYARVARQRLGRPLPGLELRVVNPDDGPGVPSASAASCRPRLVPLRGLLQGPGEDGASAIDGDGWFHTGDLGSIDERRRVMYHGRMKDMLKVGGENVAATEIEAYLAAHPAIEDGAGRRRPGRRATRGAGRVRRARARRRRDRGRADRALPAARSRASRCRATCASSTEWPMSTRRSRSSACATT